jgi:CubicO group peptidase (beta-lactamase class C family)
VTGIYGLIVSDRTEDWWKRRARRSCGATGRGASHEPRASMTPCRQLTPKSGHRDGYGFGLSVAVRRGTGVGGMPGSPGDFNCGGGTYFWVNPKEELSGVLMALATPAQRRRLRPLIE